VPRSNRLARVVDRVAHLPRPLASRALSALIGRAVPFVGTSDVKMLELSAERAVVRLENRRRVQNHIKTLHAAAMVLAAETASGMVVGMSVPDDKIPLMKSLTVDYVAKNRGGLTVTATLDDDTRRRIESDDAGEVDVPVVAVDDEGTETIRCRMLWAWRPKGGRPS